MRRSSRLYFGDNLKCVGDRREFPDASIDLVYLDAPFNSTMRIRGADGESHFLWCEVTHVKPKNFLVVLKRRNVRCASESSALRKIVASLAPK